MERHVSKQDTRAKLTSTKTLTVFLLSFNGICTFKTKRYFTTSKTHPRKKNH